MKPRRRDRPLAALALLAACALCVAQALDPARTEGGGELAREGGAARTLLEVAGEEGGGSLPSEEGGGGEVAEEGGRARRGKRRSKKAMRRELVKEAAAKDAPISWDPETPAADPKPPPPATPPPKRETMPFYDERGIPITYSKKQARRFKKIGIVQEKPVDPVTGREYTFEDVLPQIVKNQKKGEGYMGWRIPQLVEQGVLAHPSEPTMDCVGIDAWTKHHEGDNTNYTQRKCVGAVDYEGDMLTCTRGKWVQMPHSGSCGGRAPYCIQCGDNFALCNMNDTVPSYCHPGWIPPDPPEPEPEITVSSEDYKRYYKGKHPSEWPKIPPKKKAPVPTEAPKAQVEGNAPIDAPKVEAADEVDAPKVPAGVEEAAGPTVEEAAGPTVEEAAGPTVPAGVEEAAGPTVRSRKKKRRGRRRGIGEAVNKTYKQAYTDEELTGPDGEPLWEDWEGPQPGWDNGPEGNPFIKKPTGPYRGWDDPARPAWGPEGASWVPPDKLPWPQTRPTVFDARLLEWARGKDEYCEQGPQEVAGKYRSVCSPEVETVGVVDVTDDQDLIAFAKKRSHMGEVLFSLVSGAYIEFAAHMVLHLRARGFVHFFLLSQDQEVCDALVKAVPVAACGYSHKFLKYSVAGGQVDGMPQVEAGWALRHFALWLLAGNRINTFHFDLDVTMMEDFYNSFKGQYLHIEGVNMADCLPDKTSIGCLNGGLTYLQNTAPNGGARWVIGEVWKRSLRRFEGQGFGPYTLEELGRDSHFDQILLNDALESAIAGQFSYKNQFGPIWKNDPADNKQPREDFKATYKMGPKEWEKGTFPGIDLSWMEDRDTVGGLVRPLPPAAGQRVRGGEENKPPKEEKFIVAPFWVMQPFMPNSLQLNMSRGRFHPIPPMHAYRTSDPHGAGGHFPVTILHWLGGPPRQKRFAMRAMGMWHTEVNEIALPRENAESSPGAHPTIELGEDTRLLALDIEDDDTWRAISAAAETRVGHLRFLRQWMEIAAAVGRKAVQPPLPCEVPWGDMHSPEGREQGTHQFELFVRPLIRAMGPPVSPRSECQLGTWYSVFPHCHDDYVLQPHDLEYLRSRYPNVTEPRAITLRFACGGEGGSGGAEANCVGGRAASVEREALVKVLGGADGSARLKVRLKEEGITELSREGLSGHLRDHLVTMQRECAVPKEARGGLL